MEKTKCLHSSELASAGVTELEYSCAFRSSFGVCLLNSSQLMTWTKTDTLTQWILNQTELLHIKNREGIEPFLKLNFESLQEVLCSYAVYTLSTAALRQGYTIESRSKWRISYKKQIKTLLHQTNLTFLKSTVDRTLPLQAEVHPPLCPSIRFLNQAEE